MALTLWQRMLQIMAQILATSKNEQTKGVKEPLQQSQTAPKDTK